MEKIQLTLLFFLLGLSSFAQLTVEDPTYDFGLLKRADPNWADFKVVNRTDKDVVLFRLEAPKNTSVLFSSKIIPPDSSALVRVRYNPESLGNFKVEMPLHASAWNTPQRLVLKGESTFVVDELLPCPNFSEVPADPIRQLHVSAILSDGGGLENAEILIYQNGREVLSLRTDANGEASVDLPRGPYYISVAKGATIQDTSIYLTAPSFHLITQWDELPAPVAEVKPPAIPEPRAPSPVEENPEFSLREFKQSNLVFLVDVSGSMKQRGRMDLLKIAMTDLLEILRDVDRFTLMSYASEAGVIIENQQNLDREACRKAIAELELQQIGIAFVIRNDSVSM
jgi:Ca-activated chloride channel family protein